MNASAFERTTEGVCTETIVKYEGLARYKWQCKRKAVKNGLCTIHSPEYIAKKDSDRTAKWKLKSDQRHAQSCLQAAAPDLLAALTLLHDNLAEYLRINNLDGYDNHDMKMARAAISKAKRRTTG